MGKSYRVFRHNLFYHIGSASTLGQQKRFALPRTPHQPRTIPIPQPRPTPRRAQGLATRRDLPRPQLPRRLARRYTPKCYHHLYDWLLPKEVFNSDDCPDDDVWPCGEARDAKPPFFPATKVRRRRRAVESYQRSPSISRPSSRHRTMRCRCIGRPRRTTSRTDDIRRPTSARLPIATKRRKGGGHGRHCE